MTIYVSTKHNFAATTNPGTGDDSGDGYSVGSHWYNVTLDLAWYCIDATLTAAIWKLVDPIRTLASSAVQVSHTGNTDETILATVTVPGGAMGTNGLIRIVSQFSYTGTNTKTSRARFGGIGGTLYLARANTTNIQSVHERFIFNRNSASSQVGMPSGTGTTYGDSGSALATSAQNTASDVDLVFTGQLTNTGETIAIEYYLVEIMYRP